MRQSLAPGRPVLWSMRSQAGPDASAIPAGRPVCTVFATAADADACHAGLIARANRVYETLESWARVPA